jgi:sporulation protein YlmC with PRC-barrel domain
MSEREHRAYETPPGGADAAGLEDYVVETSNGERIGTVVDSVEEGGRRWVVVETGLPPFKRDRRAIPWGEVEEIDHDSLAVRIAAAAVESLQRLPSTGREGEAPSRRVTESSAPSFVPTGDVAGPTNRSGTLLGALASFALGLLTLLGVLAVLSRQGRDLPYAVALVVPATLLLISAVLGYRLWRDPYSDGHR